MGDVRAAGLTLTDLEQSLRARYDQYLHKPQVGVYIKQFRGQRVTVTGAVVADSLPAGIRHARAEAALVDRLAGADDRVPEPGSASPGW